MLSFLPLSPAGCLRLHDTPSVLTWLVCDNAPSRISCLRPLVRVAARQRTSGGVSMPRKRKNPVSLSREDRGRLEGLIAGGHASARQLTHARILLKADEG